ncbi:hypothetical protein GCM10010191_78720 [Actinomadura vinacea]|uniref:Uncharacterized protein n=1 Tax=Actinomadura vinacea TaxID=115336 RepID=A0ABP5X9F7_9ACTN
MAGRLGFRVVWREAGWRRQTPDPAPERPRFVSTLSAVSNPSARVAGAYLEKKREAL